MLSAAFAHDGARAAELTLWNAWTLDPLVLVPLGLAAFLYWRGSLRFGTREACFAGGMAALFFALVWPLDVLGERLFSAHMAQHLLMMNVAAPLIVLGVPLAAFLRALPLAWRRALAGLGAGRRWRTAWRWLCGVVAATLLQQAALWGWHTPRAVAASLESDALHIVMHATLLAAALLFWTAVLRSRPHFRGIAALLVTLKLTGAVCIMLLVQPGGFYAAYGELAAAWRLTPAEDEHLGWGLMMSIGTVSYLGAALALAAVWLSALERRGRAAASG